MNLYEFKQELFVIRENRRVMRSLRQSLATLEEDMLTSVFSGAIDYSKERGQHQSDPDSAIINAIMLTEKEKERLRKQLQELQDENAELEQLIYRKRGLGAEIVRLYFIEGKTMMEIADRLDCHRDTCYRHWNDSIKTMWEEYDNDETG